ncbi:MAG: M24 family metallopeptidase [Bacteroidota bacterium]
MNYQLRIAALRAELRKQKIDAFLTVHLPNVRYLTGFSGSNALLFVTPSRTFFLTDFRYKDQIDAEVTADEKIVGQGSLVDIAAKKHLFSRFAGIGYEKKHLSIGLFEEFTAKIGGKRLAAAENIVEDLRGVKDESELEQITKAVGITDTVFQKILGILKPGIRELDVSAEISYLHKKLGAEKDAFDTIVASGVRGALPHGAASGKRIAAGDFVTLDFGCIVNGYHSDMTRTVCIGQPTGEMKKVFAIVSEAQQKGLDAVAPGIPAKDVDAAARGHIAKKGYGQYFGHSLGHGVGLEIHENLRLASTYKKRLRQGNVVTVEPGIYLPNKFGVRIEDMVVVRESGCENLTVSPKELIIL